MLWLLSEHQQMMQVHAESSYPQEACGLLIGRSLTDQIDGLDIQVLEVQPTLNAWSPEVGEWIGGGTGKFDRFWIDPAEILRVMQEARSRGLEIVGVYHSHPDHAAIPSECDRQMAWSQYAYIILSVMQGQMAACQGWSLNAAHQFEPLTLQWVAEEEVGEMR
ncbi:MAG: M67 family metallopeptidase [Synechococcales bacterium]|nr:M67 family metallopeptidase [Synechococcales bacterium]